MKTVLKKDFKLKSSKEIRTFIYMATLPTPKASTMTMTCDLSTTVNIELVFNLVSILHPRNPDETRFIHPKNVRSKIPFFGIENAIVSAKYKGISKGIRSGQNHMMNNVVSLDLSCMNKNINLKLAKTKIQLTGATSAEMGEHAFNVICQHIDMIQNNLNYIRSLDTDLRKATEEWVVDTIGSLAPASTRLPYIDLAIIEACDFIDHKYAAFLWQYTDDFDDYTSYTEKIKYIVGIIDNTGLEARVIAEPSIESLYPGNVSISNSVYNFSLGEDVSLIQLTKHLIKKGFNVEFHNWNASHMKVTIPVIENGVNVVSNTNKLKAHRFSIHRNGSVKYTSPTFYDKAMSIKKIFLDAVSDYVPEY
jgi:hypothetical protein